MAVHTDAPETQNWISVMPPRCRRAYANVFLKLPNFGKRVMLLAERRVGQYIGRGYRTSPAAGGPVPGAKATKETKEKGIAIPGYGHHP